MEMQIWGYSGKFYLKFNDKRVYGYSIGLVNESNGTEITQISFKKDVPYIMDLTFAKYDFEKNKEHIAGYTNSKIKHIY